MLELNPFKTAQIITPTDFEQEMDEWKYYILLKDSFILYN